MKAIKTEDSIGKTLLHDLTRIEISINNTKSVKKYPAFKKGHILTYEDIPILLSMGKDHVFVVEENQIEENQTHEDDAAIFLGQLFTNPYISMTNPKEGRVDLVSNVPGVLEIDKALLVEINKISDVVFATFPNNSKVVEEERFGAVKIIPLYTDFKNLQEAQTLVEKWPNAFRVHPYTKKKIGLIITGNEVYTGKIQDGFAPIIREKLSEFGARIFEKRIAFDDETLISNYITELIEIGCEVILCTGGMSVDPDDKTPLAIGLASDTIITHGAPVFPGVMTMVGYKKNVPILGIPGGALFSKYTLLDILLPQAIAGIKITREQILAMSCGGFLKG